MSRLLRCVWVFVLAVGVIAVVPATSASAATTAPITGLTARGGYNSVQLTWQPPADTRLYRGVSIWRYEGNVDPAPAPVLVAKVDQTRTSYVDRNLTVPPSGLWAYKVYTRDAVKGGIQPQDVSDWMTSAMSGRVTDARGNGVGNVFVSVSVSAWSSGGWTRTAADGTWLVDGVISSTAIACFDPEDATGGASTTGYQPQCFDNIPSIPYHGTTGRAVPMRVGVLATHVDARLAPGGAVAGTIRDQRGRPLAHAGVTVMRSDSQVRRLVVTGADGTYRITGLSPGQYAGCAYQPYSGAAISPASATGYLSTCSDGSVGGVPRTQYPVATGSVSTSDIAVVAGGAISGRLTGPDGAPVVGAYPVRDGTYSPDARSTPTDARGAYRITGLLPGRYTVCFRAFIPEPVDGTFDPGLAARCWKAADPSAPTPIDVATSQWVKAVDVRQFARPTVAGRLVDDAGHGLAGVVVTVDDGTWTALTAADGTYTVAVEPGSHTVCFDATRAVGPAKSGYVDQCWRAQPRFGGTPTPVVVARSGAVTGIDATLAVAPGVRVTVVDAAGTPVRNATVYLYHEGQGPNVRTNAYGVATFTRVYVGEGADYTVYLSDDSWWDATPRAPYGYATVERAVTVKPGLSSVTVVAPANGVVTGTVRNADGTPYAGALVDVAGSAYVPTDPTAEDGTWTTGPIPPGTYTFCFEGGVGTGAGAHRATTCWNGASTPASATPVVVGDRAAVTGVDGVLR